MILNGFICTMYDVYLVSTLFDIVTPAFTFIIKKFLLLGCLHFKTMLMFFKKFCIRLICNFLYHLLYNNPFLTR